MLRKQSRKKKAIQDVFRYGYGILFFVCPTLSAVFFNPGPKIIAHNFGSNQVSNTIISDHKGDAAREADTGQRRGAVRRHH